MKSGGLPPRLIGSVALSVSLSCTSKPRPAPPTDEAPESLIPVYRRTVDDGIGVGAVNDAGVVLLAPTSSGVVLVLDPKGDSSGAIGRVGDGPCEFRSITFVAAIPDGAAVADVQLGLLQLCPSGGGKGISLRLPGQILAVAPAGADTLIVASRIGIDAMAILRLSHFGETSGSARVDTLRLWPTDSLAARSGEPKSQFPVITLRRDGGLVLASSIDTLFRIFEFRPDGAIASIADRIEPPVLFTDQELIAKQEWSTRQMRRSGRQPPPPLPISMMKRTKPRFSWAALGADGTGALWTRPASPADSAVPLLRYSSGAPSAPRIYLVKAPVRDIAVSGDFLATFGEDSEGLGVVALYRIPRPRL